mgnify:CR=1 FL=1
MKKVSLLVCLGLLWCDLSLADFDRAMAAYRARDYQSSYEQFYAAAVNGNETAQFNLGVMYYRGEGVEKDLSAAFAWIELSTQRGNKENLSGQEVLVIQMSPDELLAGHLLAAELAGEFELYYKMPDYLDQQTMDTELVVLDQ